VSKERNRGWQDPYVQQAFRLARAGDVPPVVMDAMRRMSAQIQDQLATENVRAAATPISRPAPRNGSGTKGAMTAAGLSSMIIECIDYIFAAAWGRDPIVMGFLQQPLLTWGISSIVFTVAVLLLGKRRG